MTKTFRSLQLLPAIRVCPTHTKNFMSLSVILSIYIVLGPKNKKEKDLISSSLYAEIKPHCRMYMLKTRLSVSTPILRFLIKMF
nr:hypothetical protein JG3_0220 [uncultured bacterium]